MKNVFLSFLLVFACYTCGLSQNDSLSPISLSPVTITSTKLVETQNKIPLSITKIAVDEISMVKQQLSLQEYLWNVPGLYTQNANNFSQDLRISIRGFGARAAFGIRGIKILIDGIPETTPDGQGQIDNLNLGIIDAIEVIRGPSSSLYGNASGGVISIHTIDEVPHSYTSAGLTFASYNFQQYKVLSAFTKEKNTFIASGNYTVTDGYREQSGFENYNFNFKWKHRFSETSKITLQANYTHNPVADDAGSLTLEEVNSDRNQAREQNVVFKTGETLQQAKLGAHFEHQLSEKIQLAAYAFFANRDFSNKLPFEEGGIVDLTRNYFGNGVSVTLQQITEKTKNKIQLGVDWAVQEDDRIRFNNISGTQGEKTFDQVEHFSTFGAYVLDHFETGNFLLRGGIRFDTHLLKAEDAYLVDGNDSGKIHLNALSPSVGVTYSLKEDFSFFGNISSSFETPALSELSANPTGGGGFNESLQAQKAYNFEIGIKRETSQQRVEAVLFYITTRDDLVPFELADFPGRTFYRNAGSSQRKGAELSYRRQLIASIQLTATYTFSDFKYNDYTNASENFDGNTLPGIPEHIGAVSLLFQKKGFKILAEGNYTGSQFSEDANTTKVAGYFLGNLHLGYSFTTKGILCSPFAGIQNIFNTYYNDNIRINAFGGRYYEPAPLRNFSAGITLKF